MNRAFWNPRLLACLLLLAAAGTWAQADAAGEENIQRLLRIVLENNPTLASQAALLRESEGLPSPRGGVALTGMSLSFATSYYDPDTGAFRLYPAGTLGVNLSLADPARALNAFALRKQREAARQDYHRIRGELITELLAAVRESLKLTSHRENLEKLKGALQDYSDLIEKQVRAGVSAPELDRLWDLRERLLSIEAELRDVESQLATMRLETAMRLAGDAWPEVLDLLKGLGGKDSIGGVQ